MKKYITLFILVLFCFSSCTTPSSQNVQNNTQQNTESDTKENIQEDTEQTAVTDENGTTYTKSFGSYTVPTGWIESSVYSTNDKFFYLLEGTEYKEKNETLPPNNISVNMGTNRYSAEDHTTFRQAIVNQLVHQLPKDTTLNGSGSHTANDYVLYTFTFSITEDDMTLNATQYYIVGDQKFVMVYESVYDVNTEEVDTIAKNIVDTFKWSE